MVSCRLAWRPAAVGYGGIPVGQEGGGSGTCKGHVRCWIFLGSGNRDPAEYE